MEFRGDANPRELQWCRHATVDPSSQNYLRSGAGSCGVILSILGPMSICVLLKSCYYCWRLPVRKPTDRANKTSSRKHYELGSRSDHLRVEISAALAS